MNVEQSAPGDSSVPVLAPEIGEKETQGVEASGLKVERLPFSVRLVTGADDLSKAVSIRHSAYARHVPALAAQLRQPEEADFKQGSVVLLAESHVDGSPLGTMRIQTNRFEPLMLERSIDLPDWLRPHPMAEATRLGVTADREGRLVKTVLFKAFYLYCRQAGIDWMVIAGRAPIDRQYQRLLFSDVYPDLGFIPLQHAGNLPHRVMCLRVADVRPLWFAARHPLHDFFFNTRHPDIEIEQVLS